MFQNKIENIEESCVHVNKSNLPVLCMVPRVSRIFLGDSLEKLF